MDAKYRATLTDLLEAVNNKIDFTSRAFFESAGKRELLTYSTTYKKRLVITLAEPKIDYDMFVRLVLAVGIYNGVSEILMGKLLTKTIDNPGGEEKKKVVEEREE